ncbi:STAS/SEC14 domain-containing protein [Mycobacterium sp. NPDC051804]|uniref:STAS/SEC14 domain-containing protein n=1 Tax=Mycobacterium sp. NPDC051804 TaxID=3364295 RepID=UPI0037A25A78
MIEVLQDMPPGVSGLRVSGKVTGDEISQFMPEMEKLLGSGEVRIVEVIESDYEGFGRGGLVEDLKQGFGTLIHHHSAFKRIAIVTDKEWVGHTVHLVGWMVPGELEVFGLDDLERAKEWAAA